MTKRAMVLGESVVLLFASLVTLGEGIRIIARRDPQTRLDVLGPGSYVLILGILLMAASLFYLVVNYRKALSSGGIAAPLKMRMRVMKTIGAMAIYVLLIYLAGYLVASIVFFLLIFKIVGVKFWPTTIILTLLLTFVYYVIFVHYADMIFPRGFLF